MSSRNPRESKPRPFPWRCADCFTLTVVPTVMDYTRKVKHDGVIYELLLPSLEIPRCQTCGETYTTNAVDEKVSDALRSRLHLLSPAQIRKKIEKLGLKQQALAERLGVAPETISRWVNGALIQSRAMDNLLRLFFALPEVREVLQGASQDPALGIEDNLKAKDLCSTRITASAWRRLSVTDNVISLRGKFALSRQLEAVGNN